jgi:hypothetical protein
MEEHAVLAASHDGGRTFSSSVSAGKPTRLGASDLRLAADGENVFVSFVDTRNRLWTAGSRDGGRTFPCTAILTGPGDKVRGGGEHSLAVDGDHLYWTWLAWDGDLFARRSLDGGATLEPIQELYDAPDYPGTPTVRADGGVVAITYGKQYPSVPRADHSENDPSFAAAVLVSRDGGASWAAHEVADEASRCVGQSCMAPYALAVEAGKVYVSWRAKGSIWLSRDLGAPQAIAPYLYAYSTSYAPNLSVHGELIAATWHSAPAAGSADIDVFSAFSADGGQTFALRTVASRANRDLYPVTAALGPDLKGAGFAYWSFEGTRYDGDTSVNFVPLSATEPDVAVLDVHPVQAARDATKLAAGRYATVQATLRLDGPARATVPVKIELPGRTATEKVLLHPGVNRVQLLADKPQMATVGTLKAKVTVEPAVDRDPANNTGEGERPVVYTRPLRVLFVPVTEEGQATPLCREVRAVAEGAEAYLRATWPLEKAVAITACARTVTHGAGLTEYGLIGPGMLMAKLDRLKLAADVDKVVGVAPEGWFKRQLIDGFENALGISQHGGGYDSVLVERELTGGWGVAHELAHNLGWTDQPNGHLDDEPAPGYWLLEKRDIPESTLDFMHSRAAAQLSDPAARWVSRKTWDYLTMAMRGVDPLAGNADVLTLSGDLSKLGPAFELPGTAANTSGPLTFEQLGPDGAVLQSRSFRAADELDGLGGQAVTAPTASFSLRVPALAAARTMRVRRGDEVLLTRARSAHPPVLKLDTPARVASIGDDLKVTYTATDADGDELTSLVSLSNDGGETWVPLPEGTTKTTVAMAGPAARVRVITSDGWNTTTQESAPFAIGGELKDGVISFSNTNMEAAVYTLPLEGGAPKKIIDQHMIARSYWSPDGTRIAYPDLNNLWTVRPDGTGTHQVTHLTDPDVHAKLQWDWPYWTFDGDLLGTYYDDIAHEANRFVLDPGTGQTKGRIATFVPEVCGYTPDGTKMLVKYGGSGFYWANADGTNETQFDFKLHIDSQECLSMSPDGRYAVGTRSFYVPDVGDHQDVVIYDLKTGAMRNLTQFKWGEDNHYATWSPTGDWIVWRTLNKQTRPYYTYELWKMHPDGTGATKLIGTTAMSLDWPAVQPLRGVAADPEPTREQRLPQAAAADATGVEGEEIALDASASKPGADGAAIVATKWDTDGDGVFSDPATVRFPDEGSYPVSVLVTDATGQSATASATVTVTNAAPKITEARVDEGGTFSARVRDTDAITAKLDGKPVPVIASDDGYLVAGEGETLIVEDGDGGRDEATATRVPAPALELPPAGHERVEPDSPAEATPTPEPDVAPVEASTPEPARPSHTGSKAADTAEVEALADRVLAATTFTLPSTRACVSRRHFRIRVKKGSYASIVVWVNGKRVQTLRGKRITATVDLRGLPKGRFTVKIAATLKAGKVITDTRKYRTCTSKKGGRR